MERVRGQSSTQTRGAKNQCFAFFTTKIIPYSGYAAILWQIFIKLPAFAFYCDIFCAFRVIIVLKPKIRLDRKCKSQVSNPWKPGFVGLAKPLKDDPTVNCDGQTVCSLQLRMVSVTNLYKGIATGNFKIRPTVFVHKFSDSATRSKCLSIADPSNATTRCPEDTAFCFLFQENPFSEMKKAATHFHGSRPFLIKGDLLIFVSFLKLVALWHAPYFDYNCCKNLAKKMSCSNCFLKKQPVPPNYRNQKRADFQLSYSQMPSFLKKQYKNSPAPGL